MLLSTLLLSGYLAMIALTFAYFYYSFYRDKSTARHDLNSWKVIGVASLFWPLVLPLSYLERKAKKASYPPERYEEGSADVTFNTQVFCEPTSLQKARPDYRKRA